MTKDLQQEKEQLKKRLNEIENLARKKLIEMYYHVFKRLEGNCYKKSPKNPYDYWYEYTKVLEIKEEDIFYDNKDNKVLSRFRGVTFFTDKYENFSIRQDNSYVHLLGKKITEKEFNQAFNNQLSRAKKLLTK